MFNFRPPERLLSEYVPLVGHAESGVVLNRDDSALAVIEVEGLPWETLEPEQIRGRWSRLNRTWCNIATDGLIIGHLVCRGLCDPSIYPDGDFRSPYAAALDARYRARLLDGRLYWNRTLLVLQLRSPRYAGEWIGEQLARRSQREMDDEPPEERIARLNRICDLLATELAAYRPHRLGLRETRGQLFSEIAEAIVFAMTGVWRPIGLPAGPMSHIFSERIIVGRETIEIRGPGRSTFVACFGMREFPARTPPGIFDPFLSSSYRCTIKQTFRFIAKADAITRMGRKQNRMLGANDRARSQIAELDTAMDDVQSGRMVMGDYGLVVTVFCDDIASLGDIATAAWRDLADGGALSSREDKALEAAYVYIIPGNNRYCPRPGVLSSRNYAAMAPMHAYPAGEADGFWDRPLMLVRTLGGTPYRLQLHVNGVGNGFICGEVGSGKTALLAMTACQAERLGAQVVYIDKDRGAEICIRALGGRYLQLRNPTNLAPLKALDATPDDLNFLAQLIRGLIVSGSDYTMTPEEDRRLAVGLRAVMALPPANRWLGEIRAFLGPSSSGAGARLEKWCAPSGELAWVVDNERDDIRLDANVLGFDCTKFLDDRVARGPVMAVLFNRLERLVDGRRLIFIIDEGWKAIEEPAFAEVIKNAFKTYRKLNAPVIFATQSPRDALVSEIGHTIREQSPTIISFANSRPDQKDYGEGGLGLTPREFEIVRQLRPGSGVFLLKQGDRSVVAHLPLDGLDDDLAVLSGNEGNVLLLDQARAEVGDDDPVRLIARFHELRRVRDGRKAA